MTTITPPSCPFCHATMRVVPREDVRDALGACGHVRVPSVSIECQCPDCRNVGIVTTLHTGEMPKVGP